MALTIYWSYKAYTNDFSVRDSNTMYYIALVVSVLGLAKSIYDYKRSLKIKE
ncbi:hypothetical protein [Pontimicrobium sp. MEBiC01747]